MGKPITRGQHHLPQFLLKGFASRSRNKEVFTWLFRKEGLPVEANVKGVAKARDFYGKVGESDLEQQLSEMEDSFAGLVRQLRAGSRSVDKHHLCQFVANTQIRTANLRSGVSEALSRFIGEFGNALQSPAGQARLLEGALSGLRLKMEAGELDSLLEQLSSAQREKFFKELVPNVRKDMTRHIKEMTEDLAQRMPALTEPLTFRDSQNKLLSENPSPEPRVQHLMELNWTVEDCSEPLLLGDVGVVAGSRTGELMNVLRHDPELATVYLPISSNRLLLGQRAGVPIASVAELNLASVELSREFFVSGSPAVHRDLQSRIGISEALVSREEVQSIVSASLSRSS